jgi:PhnB protein
MTADKTLQIDTELHNKRIHVTRYFDAAPELVWRAWTEAELLDQWWAPKPYRAETKAMHFEVGGQWLYSMVGPQGDRHFCRVDFSDIQPKSSFKSVACFCDEAGVRNMGMPEMFWNTEFRASGNGTEVVATISFTADSEMQTIIGMGFREGFSMGLQNLEHYLATGFKIRGEMKADNKPRAAFYLNFPGTTEAAFNFYREVFNGKFTGRGMQRFGDFPMPEGMPPMSEADQKLIIHTELTIMDGVVLMATDVPESMGMQLVKGNNMHINLEPGSREETERLFNTLSAGGTVTMPLQDIFWGAYYAAFQDKYGTNWMLNHQEAQ